MQNSNIDDCVNFKIYEVLWILIYKLQLDYLIQKFIFSF